MSRQWNPGQGDVAVVSWESKSGCHGGTALAMRCSDSYDESHWRTQTFGVVRDDDVKNVRPLVVIDPEDRERVERLADALTHARTGHKYGNAYPGEIDKMQTALREVANPTPPKPDEPTGLGAVVEDADGVPWVRCENADLEPHWYARNKMRKYSEVAAVRVLSEGVTP